MWPTWQFSVPAMGFTSFDHFHPGSNVARPTSPVPRWTRSTCPCPYSRWSFRGRAFDYNAGWRIDYQLARPGLAERVVSARPDPSRESMRKPPRTSARCIGGGSRPLVFDHAVFACQSSSGSPHRVASPLVLSGERTPKALGPNANRAAALGCDRPEECFTSEDDDHEVALSAQKSGMVTSWGHRLNKRAL